MPRLVPVAEVLEKTSALKTADTLGREFAQSAANEELAKLAGIALAGGLTQRDWGLLKEAGLVGNIFKTIGGGLSRAGGSVTRGAQKVVERLRGAPAASQRATESFVRQAPTTVGKVPTGALQGKMDVKLRAAEKGRGFHRQDPWAVPSQPGKGGFQNPGDPVADPRARLGAGQAGKVRPARRAQEQAATTTQDAPGKPTPKTTNTGQTTPQGGAPQTPEGKKGSMGWLRAAPWIAGGGLAYGLYKGVPWAARQLEQSASSPMAYGGGWSPIPYGYGYSPWGPQGSGGSMGQGA